MDRPAPVLVQNGAPVLIRVFVISVRDASAAIVLAMGPRSGVGDFGHDRRPVAVRLIYQLRVKGFS
jgi:hypothetical protein